MKFYEHHYEDYLHSLDEYNIHPELSPFISKLTPNIHKLGNLILYGPSGTGKYTQSLQIIRKYSPSSLKYEKKIKINSDKTVFTYKISDIHYEIDMSQLGCNPKTLWNEIFSQIVDIISVKQEKTGIILCKNFHMIHNELLEIFYSYIKQYNIEMTHIIVRFIIITEHISFIPNNILNSSKIISIKRPSKESYAYLLSKVSSLKITQTNENYTDMSEYFSETLRVFCSRLSYVPKNHASCIAMESPDTQITYPIQNIHPENILNIKEIKYFSLIESGEDVPSDLFDIICNKIIQEMENPNKIVFTNFRDVIYDILIYNLDVTECIWYIFTYFIKKGALSDESISKILIKTFTFLKYYNNNYRPIYHLESILFYIIIQIYSYEL